MDDIPKIGITGMPSVGKTTTLLKIIEFLEENGYKVQGMITEPFIKKKKRVGFYVVNWQTKEKEIFAHVDMDTKDKVGKYGVDINVLEKVGVPAIEDAILDEEVNIIIIDEIGKMELFSQKFQEMIWVILNSQNPFLATITKRPHPIAIRIKARADVQLFEITKANRNELVERLVAEIEANLPGFY